MSKSPIMSHAFVLVVVEHEGRFLLVRERKHGQTYYLPAGGVEVGETLVTTAVRETMEEAGVHVRPTHLLAMDQTWLAVNGTPSVRYRFVLSARVLGDPTPKLVADRHSLGARWVAPGEIRGLPLRATEVLDYVAVARSSAHNLALTAVTQTGYVRPEPPAWAD